jgi:hypothetical protein
VARILDTSPDFDAYARKAFLESPVLREQSWRDQYEGKHPEVFASFYAEHEATEGRAALVRELSKVRQTAAEGAPVMRQLIDELDPAVQKLLRLPASPSPLHVLVVGPYSTNAAVGRLGDDVALFHCLEWFDSPEGARVIVAHEGTHAWHEVALGQDPPEDAAWTTFYEGVAIQASRALVPGRDEYDYFWYGHAGFEAWLPWCQEHRDELLERLRASLDDPEATETFFGGGLVDGQWRVGYFLADVVVAGLGRPLPELVAMSVAEGQEAVRAALGAS